VSPRTGYLVVGKDPGSKLERARSLRVATLDEKRFLSLVRSGRE
jgi:NAD-dependent DNA ligase